MGATCSLRMVSSTAGCSGRPAPCDGTRYVVLRIPTRPNGFASSSPTVRLLQNHDAWCEQNAAAESPNASLWTLLEIHTKQFGKIILRGISTAGAAAERQLEEHLAALREGLVAPKAIEIARMSWLEFALNPFPDLFAAPPGGVSAKVKDALLTRRLTDKPDRGRV